MLASGMKCRQVNITPITQKPIRRCVKGCPLPGGGVFDCHGRFVNQEVGGMEND